MSTVLRFIFVVPFGFVAASLAASFAMVWPFIDLPAGIAEADPVFLLQSAVVFAAQAMQIGSVTLLPWFVFMLMTEIFGLASVLLHVAASFMVGVCIIIFAYGRHVPHMSVQTAIVVASLSFGLVYWIIAGRRAGRWRRRMSQTTSMPDKATL